MAVFFSSTAGRPRVHLPDNAVPLKPTTGSVLMNKPIEDYGFIGNMLSSALVARDDSIDWLCLPRFDSDACFAALLGSNDNGRWLIAPKREVQRVTRRYRPGTTILKTSFETATGTVTLIDFMPLAEDEEHVDLVRIVRGGCAAPTMACAPWRARTRWNCERR